MPPENAPCLEKWEVQGPLGGGGQGTTFLVRSKADGTEAVLKVLRKQDSLQARGRMFREVTNLKTLHPLGCKVPAVLDANVEKFESPDVQLFFIMERIFGDNLTDLIKRKGPLPLDLSAAIVLDIASTIAQGLIAGVQHRDLKPDNLKVQSMDPADVVILDYGLSFNSEQDDDIAKQSETRQSETLDNSFLSLPERCVPGGDRKDHRSDLTGVCGILHFCLTGEFPVDLQDQNGRPPHRRPGRSVRDHLKNDPRIPHLEAFLDTGFATSIDSRFQSTDELVSRLRDVLAPSAARRVIDPWDFARQSAERLLKHDRKTQLGAYTASAQTVIQTLQNELGKITGKGTGPYRFVGEQIQPDYFQGLQQEHPGTEKLATQPFAVALGLAHNRAQRLLAYDIRAKGSQCGVFRKSFKAVYSRVPNTPPNYPETRTWHPIAPATCIVWYEGTSMPEVTILSDDLRASVSELMQSIESEVLG